MGMVSSACQTLVTGMARYSANAPGRLTPTPLVARQSWRRPARQFRQRPHTMWPSPETMSPTARSLTFSPKAATEPTNSWPTVMGTGMVFRAQASQFQMCTSVPQIDDLCTRTRTSLIPNSGTGTSSSQRPGAASLLTRALMVFRMVANHSAVPDGVGPGLDYRRLAQIERGSGEYSCCRRPGDGPAALSRTCADRLRSEKIGERLDW